MRGGALGCFFSNGLAMGERRAYYLAAKGWIYIPTAAPISWMEIGGCPMRFDSSRRTNVSTLKTALVVVLLLAVLYGVYNTLNAPPKAPAPEAAKHDWQPPVINVGETANTPPALPGTGVSMGAPSLAKAASPAGVPPLAGAAELPGSAPRFEPALPRIEASLSPPDASPTTANGKAFSPIPPLEGGAPLTGSAASVPPLTNTFPGPNSAPPLPNNLVSQPAATPSAPPLSLPATEIPPVVDAAGAQANPKSAEGVATVSSFPAAEAGRAAANRDTPGERSSFPQTSQGSLEPSPAVREVRFERAMQEAQQLLSDRKMADALKRLTEMYGSPDLPPQSAGPFQELLDQLAGTVIYSTEHHLEEPYRVQAGETLEQISEIYAAPVQLLANINGLKAPYTLYPGQELKVLRGPFRAEVTLSPATRLTLFLGPYYAGRFDATLGALPPAKEGNFTVLQKMVDRPFYNPGGGAIAPHAPGNPYGGHWLGLEDQLCIHGSGPSADSSRGCIGLNARDAADVFAILSVGSRVIVRR